MDIGCCVVLNIFFDISFIAQMQKIVIECLLLFFNQPLKFIKKWLGFFFFSENRINMIIEN